MTTTRFISPSLPRRVLSRLSYLPYTKGFPRIFLSPIFSPGYHLCSGIIFTYICLYLFFFFLSCTVRRFFLLSNSTYQFIYFPFFLYFFFFSLTNSVRIPQQSIRFKFRFRNRRSRIRTSIRYLFLLRFYPFLFSFLSFFLSPEEFDTRSLIDQARATRFLDVKFTCSTRIGAVLEAWPTKVASEQLSSNHETSIISSTIRSISNSKRRNGDPVEFSLRRSSTIDRCKKCSTNSYAKLFQCQQVCV